MKRYGVRDALCAIAMLTACLGAPPRAGAQTTAPPASTAVQPGMRIDIDPATGALIEPPSGVGAPANARAAGAGASTSAAGLREVQGSSPAGGVSVDLQGRFRNTMRIDVGPQGQASTHCESGAGDPPRAQP